MDRSRCLNILEGYGVGPRACQLLRIYWSRLRIVAKVGGYYGAAFRGVWGVTQGDPLSPTIFNVVVDLVVRHWVSVMAQVAEERGGRGQEGRHQNALFYADDGMVALSDPRWLKGTFSTLVGLFDRVGLKTNVRKTSGMVCRLCQSARTQSEMVYGIMITGAALLYRERQRGRIQCKECGEEMALGSLVGHMQTQHGRTAEGRRRWKPTPPGKEPGTYRMAFPTTGGLRNCLVEGCLG